MLIWVLLGKDARLGGKGGISFQMPPLERRYRNKFLGWKKKKKNFCNSALSLFS